MSFHLFIAENCPWCWWWSANPLDYGKFGEWAWVGRVYA